MRNGSMRELHETAVLAVVVAAVAFFRCLNGLIGLSSLGTKMLILISTVFTLQKAPKRELVHSGE